LKTNQRGWRGRSWAYFGLVASTTTTTVQKGEKAANLPVQ
jgi:hypothetical protein